MDRKKPSTEVQEAPAQVVTASKNARRAIKATKKQAVEAITKAKSSTQSAQNDAVEAITEAKNSTQSARDDAVAAIENVQSIAEEMEQLQHDAAQHKKKIEATFNRAIERE